MLAGIAGSTILAWVLFEPFTDPSRIYYGTDTRAVCLLAGVALAFLWPASRLRPLTERRPRIVLEATGVAAAVIVLALALTRLGELDAALYKGGFLWVALATAVAGGGRRPPLLAGSARPSACAPLVWIGLRSYGIYLWHWPIIMLTRPDEDVPLDGAPLATLQIGLTVGVAALSYTYVETPIRRGGLRALRDGLRRDTAGFPRRARRRGGVHLRRRARARWASRSPCCRARTRSSRGSPPTASGSPSRRPRSAPRARRAPADGRRPSKPIRPTRAGPRRGRLGDARAARAAAAGPRPRRGRGRGGLAPVPEGGRGGAGRASSR